MCLDIDINNCFPTLLLNVLEDELDVMQYPMLCAYVRNYKAWRSFVADYAGIDMKEAKQDAGGIDLPHHNNQHQTDFWYYNTNMRASLTRAAQFLQIGV